MRPKARLWILLALLLLVPAGAALARVIADSNEDSSPSTTEAAVVRPRGNTTLAQARRFRVFPVYFAGRAVAGYPLYAVQRTDRTSPAPHTEFVFIYGSCVSRRGQGCAPPLTIISWPACYRYETRYTIPHEERMTLRGVPARVFRKASRIELYPARTTIVVNGPRRGAALLRIAPALRGVNVRHAARANLPPRPPHVRVGTIKCR
jgi:hypothetical protein